MTEVMVFGAIRAKLQILIQHTMSTMKVIELLCNSKVGWEDAAKNGIAEASRTLKNIRSIYIKDQSATVENGKITEYRITAKVTFAIEH